VEFKKSTTENEVLSVLAFLIAENTRHESRNDRRVIVKDRERPHFAWSGEFVHFTLENGTVWCYELELELFSHESMTNSE
jgi:hypothetical protein